MFGCLPLPSSRDAFMESRAVLYKRSPRPQFHSTPSLTAGHPTLLTFSKAESFPAQRAQPSSYLGVSEESFFCILRIPLSPIGNVGYKGSMGGEGGGGVTQQPFFPQPPPSGLQPVPSHQPFFWPAEAGRDWTLSPSSGILPSGDPHEKPCPPPSQAGTG